MWSKEAGAGSPGTHRDLFIPQPYRLNSSSSKQESDENRSYVSFML